MHKYLPKIFIFLDKYNNGIYQNNNIKIGVIYRNYKALNREIELIKIAKFCKRKRYQLFVSNDISNVPAKEVEIIGNADNTFTFDTSYNNIYCYGKEVDDFHALDKNKLFALNFSATQELIRKVELLEQEIMLLKNK